MLSLPKGPGSIEGLGESFEPQLNTGTAAYRVRLAVPPGVAGFQPDLALVYNSGYGNGPVGLGWRLDIPWLQRQTDKGLPAYTDDDLLLHSVAGELVPQGGGLYRAKIEGAFLKVHRTGAGFTVWERNGTRHWFGTGAESRLDTPRGTFEWRLKRSEDRNGNAILYGYEQADGQVYLTEIRYALASATDDKSIHFSYQARPDAVMDYRSRSRIVTARRLSTIEMRSFGVLVRAYRIEYGDGAPSLPQRIVQVGADGASTLPPLSFDYSVFDRTLARTAAMGEPPPRPVYLTNPNVDLVDIDGDGLPDVFYTPIGNSPHRFYLNRGRGDWAAGPVEPQLSPRRTLQTNGVLMADMNGDGRSDLFVKGSNEFGYFKNQGALAWEETDWVSAGAAPRFGFEDTKTRLLDLNNDKLIDVLRDTGSSYLVWLNPGAGEWSADYDRQTNGTYLPLDRDTVKLGDMNGDRIEDLVSIIDGYCAYFPGMGFGEFDTEVPMGNPPFNLDLARVTLTDIDHDGLADWVEVGNRFLRIWRNAGDGRFEDERLVENTPATSGKSAFRFADLDGDGSLDLLVTNEDSADPYQMVSFNAGVHPYLLMAIRNGLGQETRIDYRSSIEDYLRDRDAGNPWSRKLPFPVQVVSRVTVRDNNSGQEYVTDYRYRDGYYDGAEKEFRGFGQVTKVEQGGPGAPGVQTSYSFDVGDQQESRKGMALSQAVLETGGTLSPPAGLFEVADHGLTTRTLATGTNGVPVTYSFTQQTDTRIFEGTASPVTLRHAWDQDGYGNTTADLDYGIVAGTDPGAGADELLNYTDYRIDTANWVIDRPSRVRKTDLAGGLVSLQRLTYDARGNLTLDERSPDGQTFIPVAAKTYDGFGNVLRLTDANGHWRGLDYDATFHAFPVRETIGGLGLTMAADYDLGLGLMTGFTDPNGQTTGFGYDTFGRLTRIIKPGDSAALPTQSFEYRLADPVSAIVTRTREQSGEPGTYDSLSWFDGLGRKLQTRAEGAHGDWVVSEAAVFNQRRGIARQWLPHFAASPDYADPAATLPHTDLEYDARGRSVRETNPDGTFRATRYLPLTKVASDEEDTLTGGPHAGTPQTSISDGRQRLIEVREVNGSATYVTRYGYDGQDNLTRIQDDQGNVKTLTFDGLGRKTRMVDPDKGLMTYAYDGVGNLLGTTDAKGQGIAYTYDAANRTVTESLGAPHPSAASTGTGTEVQVRYHYDTDLPPDGPALQNTLVPQDESARTMSS
ncbi:toxin TcdB middle/N-terminal domain-containing protein [uncultured Thiodictyon sp.]|uniref:toxin TcdB middle/N-terminal domain-containing protein n=1 Tax=uncultured Thiodictyon sp. TaxID=1846217 RepID=UPI0025E8E134|nr:toxin TcdB middle/N-terminal domain-containing protein [uncultured Thiodictyon sp.]